VSKECIKKKNLAASLPTSFISSSIVTNSPFLLDIFISFIDIVYDKYGNRWLDWSSGVLVTNAGHGAPEVRQAILDQVNSGLLHNYVFPSEERAALEAIAVRRRQSVSRRRPAGPGGSGASP
jgi:4-aminobutyrate aminotransferase-like enzyme